MLLAPKGCVKHNTANVLNATELYILKWLEWYILCYVYLTIFIKILCQNICHRSWLPPWGSSKAGRRCPVCLTQGSRKEGLKGGKSQVRQGPLRVTQSPQRFQPAASWDGDSASQDTSVQPSCSTPRIPSLRGLVCGPCPHPLPSTGRHLASRSVLGQF